MSDKNFMSYGDAETVFAGFSSAIKGVADNVKLNTQDLTTVSRSKNNITMTVESVKKANTAGTWNGNTYTRDNLTYELLTDDGVIINGINVSGNNSGYANFNLGLSVNVGAGRYTLSQQDILNNDACYTTVSTDGSYKAWTSGHHGSESYDTISGICSFILVCHDFDNANPVTVYPMNRISTETDPTFAPYIPSVNARLDAAESGLTNLTNDMEGEWTEISVSDILTADQSVTLDTIQSKAFQRGKRIRTLLYFNDALTFGADGSHVIGTIKTAYKPVYSRYHNCVVNTNTSSGRVFGTATISTFTSGNIILYANKPSGSIGNSSYSWSAGYGVVLEWEIA